MTLPVGATVAGYTVLRLLGQGGMGAVYLVQHPSLPRRDVLKLLHGAMAASPSFRARFQHEARLAAGLDHPNIVQVYDQGAEGPDLWIRMQYVDGSDAAAAVAQGPLEPLRALHVVRSVAAALDHAHARGLLHRDVKPANILLAPGHAPGEPERVLLTDFGIAKALDEDVALTGTGQSFLSPAYAAPERFGSGPVDARVDVYALGCVLYELLTGSVPFPRTSLLASVTAHLGEPPPDPRALRPGLPAGVTDVVATAMAKEPGDRYASCGVLAEALTTALRPLLPSAEDPGRTRVTGGHPPGPHRVAVRARAGSRPWTTVGGVDTATLPADRRTVVETAVQQAVAARERPSGPEVPGPGAVSVEVDVEHPGGGERFGWVHRGPAHPPEWDRVVAAVLGGDADTRLDAAGADGGRGRGPLRPRVVLAAAVAALAVAGATTAVVLTSGPKDASAADPAADPAGSDPAGPVPTAYGATSNTNDVLGYDFEESGALAGMVGTSAGADLPEDFLLRVAAADAAVEDLDVVAASYDALVVTALAAEWAGSNDARVFRAAVGAMTTGGERCTDPAACLALAEDGTDPDYDGLSGPLELTEAGEPAVAPFAVRSFTGLNELAPDAEYVLGGDPGDADGSAPPAAGGDDPPEPLLVGALLPYTGTDQRLAPAAAVGFALALEDVNAAGGVHGRPVELVEADAGDYSSGLAGAAVADLVGRGAHALVGPISDVVISTVLEQVTAAGVLLVASASDSDTLVGEPDADLFARTSPGDRLEALALADLVLADGHRSVGVLALDGQFTELAGVLERRLAEAGIPLADITVVAYEDDDPPEEAIAELVEVRPDAVVLLGFTEDTAALLAALNAAGIGPAR
ncbi:protein kinase domain-containing protein [Blastococcus sp. SYSU D00820]